jgi:hypothetical protein
VELPGERTREVTLDTGASAHTPVRRQGPGLSLPEPARAIPCKVQERLAVALFPPPVTADHLAEEV